MSTSNLQESFARARDDQGGGFSAHALVPPIRALAHRTEHLAAYSHTGEFPPWHGTYLRHNCLLDRYFGPALGYRTTAESAGHPDACSPSDFPLEECSHVGADVDVQLVVVPEYETVGDGLAAHRNVLMLRLALGFVEEDRLFQAGVFQCVGHDCLLSLVFYAPTNLADALNVVLGPAKAGWVVFVGASLDVAVEDLVLAAHEDAGQGAGFHFGELE
jgi:hypothetical protein